MRLSLILAAVAATASLTARAEMTCFTGYAYHLDGGEFAYTEEHAHTRRSGEVAGWEVTYRAPDGRIIARKTMDFSHHRFVPVFTTHHVRSGDMEGIRHDGDHQWQMVERDGATGERLAEPFRIRAETAADSGFHPFVQAQFEQLMAGERLRFRFVVAGYLDVIGMRAIRIGDTAFEGDRAVRFRARLDLPVVNWFVDDLVLTYDPDSRRLLEYRGISNMQNADGDRYPVRVSYYSEAPPESDVPARGCRESMPEPE